MMKKNFLRRMLTVFLTFSILMSNFFVAVIASTEGTIPEKGLRVYSCPYDVFVKFLENPSHEIFGGKGYETGFSILSKSNSQEGYIQETVFWDDSVSTRTFPEGGHYFRLGNVWLYLNFLDFAKPESLKQYLAENNIDGEIRDVAIINMESMAATIWVQVDDRDYFITIDELFSDYINDEYKYRDDPSAYVYRLYTYEEYYNRFSAKDATLIIDGENVSSGNYVKKHNSGFYVPFRAVMEKLGSKVDWDTENGNAILTIKGNKYIFNHKTLDFKAEGSDRQIIYMPPGGAYYYAEIIDDRIIMNDILIEKFIVELEYEIHRDYANGIIEFSTKKK